MIGRIDFRSGETVNVASTVRQFEAQRDLLAAVENRWLPGGSGEALISRYGYVNDNLARRTGVVRTGAAFVGGSGDHHDLYEYNDLNELTGSRRFAGAAIPNPLPGPQEPRLVPSFAYGYDGIGSRNTMTVCGAETCPPSGGEATDYDVNAVNQYTEIEGPPPLAPEVLSYDDDGNLTADGMFAYTWDGENRLIGVEPTSPLVGSKKLVFTYDYMSRRVRKQVYEWDASLNGGAGGWSSSASMDRRFVYDGWNLLYEAEYASSEEVIVRKYTWGMDVSGSRYGAGGIGGLLAMEDLDPATEQSGGLLCFYDGNGNVGQLVATADGEPAARYEYDPFGNTLVAAGDYASVNPFRFSTKYADDESGLYYYGYRYYSARQGRWLGREPLGEEASANLYAFVNNATPGGCDPTGLRAQSSSTTPRPCISACSIWTACKRASAAKYGLNPNDPRALQRAMDTNGNYQGDVTACYNMVKAAREQGGSKICPDMPTTGSEPPYDPKWDGGDRAITAGSNCYSYACSHKREGRFGGLRDVVDPGARAGTPCNVTCASVEQGLMADAKAQGATVSKVDCNWSCPKDTYKVMLVIRPGSSGPGGAVNPPDYHWYVQNSGDDCGSWSHKPGTTPNTDRDRNGYKISDPRQASSNGYLNATPCGCYCLPKGGIETGP